MSYICPNVLIYPIIHIYINIYILMPCFYNFEKNPDIISF